MKLAAIDLGSNACRLLINDVLLVQGQNPDFARVALIRVPLRLGFDVFEMGEISAGKIEKLIKTIKAFKYLLDVYEVEHLKACATSAMRDAANSAEIVAQVKTETDIKLHVISGEQEASYIYENHVAENLNSLESYLYTDVGGGSTELTFFSKGQIIFKQSFDIGTIRMLKNNVPDKAWHQMKQSLQTAIKGYPHVTCIGSGGNINKIFSLSKRKEGKPLTIDLLRNYYKEFTSVSLQQRMSLYKLREDRADVIVPALLIYINVMRWAEAEEIHVPKIGLADGLIQNLYEEVTASGVMH